MGSDDEAEGKGETEEDVVEESTGKRRASSPAKPGAPLKRIVRPVPVAKRLEIVELISQCEAAELEKLALEAPRGVPAAGSTMFPSGKSVCSSQGSSESGDRT